MYPLVRHARACPRQRLRKPAIGGAAFGRWSGGRVMPAAPLDLTTARSWQPSSKAWRFRLAVAGTQPASTLANTCGDKSRNATPNQRGPRARRSVSAAASQLSAPKAQVAAFSCRRCRSRSKRRHVSAVSLRDAGNTRAAPFLANRRALQPRSVWSLFFLPILVSFLTVQGGRSDLERSSQLSI